MTNKLKAALTVAGSDSGGGAGIQADLKTFEALDIFGTAAITCVTAQNPDTVNAVVPLSPDLVAEQIRTVCQGFPIAAAKTGMLYSAEIIEAVGKLVCERIVPIWVVDPVMVATSGARLLRDDAIEALQDVLLPHATVLTPNAPEAEVLWGHPVRSVEALKTATRDIGRRFKTGCVGKGGHLLNAAHDGDTVTDIVWDGHRLHECVCPAVPAAETHGTGCTFSAALTAFLARNHPLHDAARRAQQFVSQALRNARPLGRHTPLRWRHKGR